MDKPPTINKQVYRYSAGPPPLYHTPRLEYEVSQIAIQVLPEEKKYRLNILFEIPHPVRDDRKTLQTGASVRLYQRA